MILLQAMMALPFALLALLIVLFVLSFLLVVLFNFLQPKLFPDNPKYIAWYWIVILPLLIMAVLITYLMTHDDIFKYT
jgi:hypothetical protein